jgi:hypothetical protein
MGILRRLKGADLDFAEKLKEAASGILNWTLRACETCWPAASGSMER